MLSSGALWIDIQTAREVPDPAQAFRTIFNELDQSVGLYLPELWLAWCQTPETVTPA